MCKALYARYGLLCYLHISQGKAHRWLGTRRVLALYRKTNNWIRRTITEPFPTLSLFISCPSLENTATNKSLPAQRAHSLLELPSHFLQSPASPPGYARISGWVLQKGPQIGVQAALSKKKIAWVMILSWRGPGHEEEALGFEDIIQCTKDQSRETNSAPEMKSLPLLLTTSVLFWRLLRRVLAGPTLFQFSAS